MKFGRADANLLRRFGDLPWTGLKTCHVMVDLPDGFLSDFLKPCVALEHLSSIGMGRRVLSMSPTTFPRLHSTRPDGQFIMQPYNTCGDVLQSVRVYLGPLKL